MRTERMPWTCRWSEYRPAERPSVWMEEWLSEWACLAERRRDTVPTLDRCVACCKWEPREGWSPRAE